MSNLDPKRMVSAAMGMMPAVEVEIDFQVDAAMAGNNLKAIYELAPKLALLPKLQLDVTYHKVTKHFGKETRISELKAHVKLEQAKLRSERATPSPGSLPEIQVNGRPLRDISADSMRALAVANDPPSVFIRSGQMVQVSIDERDRPSVVSVSQDSLRGKLDRAGNFIRRGAESDTAIAPPMDVVKDILALPSAQWSLPPIDVVVEVPTLRPDGTVLDRAGYDEATRMLFIPTPGLDVGRIPDGPTNDEIYDAVSLIEEAIGEFPFADETDADGRPLPGASRANLCGLLLTPIVRHAISGSVPLALVDAPQAGTGKSLLVEVISIIATGRPASMMPFPRDETEVQKSIGATLLRGEGLVVYDNYEGVLSSPTLALALTAREFQTRILGSSQNLAAPNRATWILTGNNIRPSGDMPRRCYRVRLDAKKANPFLGREFRHQDLLGWVSEKRAELLRSLLIMARAWFARGKVQCVKNPLGSFRAWHQTIGGILESAGVHGFLSNLEVLWAVDEMAIQWEVFLKELKDAYPDGDWFSTRQIASEVRSASAISPCRFVLPDSLAEVDLRKPGSLEKSLGNSFRKRLGQRLGDKGVFLDKEQVKNHSNTGRWRVLDLDLEEKLRKLNERKEVPAEVPENG